MLGMIVYNDFYVYGEKVIVRAGGAKRLCDVEYM